MYKRLLLLLLAGLPALLPGQTRDIVVDADGRIVAPATLWDANAIARSDGGLLWPEWFRIDVQAGNAYDVLTDSTTATIACANLQQDAFDGFRSQFTLLPFQVLNPSGQPILFSTSDPQVATMSPEGVTTWQASGAFTATATLGGWSETVSLVNNVPVPVTRDTVLSGVDGSLRAAVTAPWAAAIAQDDGAIDSDLFTTANHAGGIFIRNLESWAYVLAPPLAWTGLPVSTASRAAGQNVFIRGALISPNLLAVSRHNAPAIGEVFKFLDSAGDIQTATVTARRVFGNADGMIVRLSPALPATVQPLLLPPSGWDSRFGYPGKDPDQPNALLQLPAVHITRALRAHTLDLAFFGSSFQGSAGMAYSLPRNPDRLPYAAFPTNGDSGQPALFSDGTRLILLSTWWTANVGPAFLADHPELITAVDALGGIPPTAWDISAYTDFSGAPPPPGPN